MLNRIDSDKEPQVLTKSISDSIYQILNETFEKDLETTPYDFYLYGEVFEKETLLIITLINKECDIDAISCFLSCDQTISRKKNDIDLLINLYGEIFEEFSSKQFQNIDFDSLWQSHTKESRLFFKITRENILLTLQANKILKESSPS